MDPIFSNNKPSNNPGRNGFDPSNGHALVMRPGVARPVSPIETVPNSAYRINVADIVRTGSLQTAAFVRGKQELDFFFVPFNQLYSRWDAVFFGRGDLRSPSQSDLPSDELPLCSYRLLLHCACLPYVFMRFLRGFYEVFNISYQSSWSVPFNYTPSGLLSYVGTRIFSHAIPFDLVYYVEPMDVADQMQPKKFLDLANSGEFIGADILQLWSTLEYGDHYSNIKTIVDQTFFNHVTGQQPITDITRFGVWANGFIDELFNSIDVYVKLFNDRKINILRFCAYQKVWKDFYRDSVNDDSILYSYASSMDYDVESEFSTSTLVDDLLSAPDNIRPWLTFMRPRFRKMKRDLSTGLYSSPQFGNFATISDTMSWHQDDPSIGAQQPSSAFSIKFALALERYRQTLLRAGSRTKDLLMSEFGVKSQYIDDTYCRHIGSFDGSLDVNKVSATAETGSYSVGDLAANVFSSLQGDTIEFTCNDNGIILGVLSFITDPMHNATGISPFNYKYRQFDYYHDAFDNLGLQPVSSSIFSLIGFDSGGTAPKESTLGFCARNFEYKTRLDLAHDTFMGSVLVPNSHIPQFSNLGSDSNYVELRDIAQTLSDIKDRSYLYPSCMDTLFTQRDTGDPENAHFKVALQVNISAILPMSTLGLI